MCPPTKFEGLTRAGAVRRMLVIPAPCAAGEDSSSGILSAHAGMRVVAMPDRAFPPSETALKISDSAIPSARSPKRIEEVR
jgi:beta-phosphoglucomutase-like phosphatase (HAD superfamily)